MFERLRPLLTVLRVALVATCLAAVPASTLAPHAPNAHAEVIAPTAPPPDIGPIVVENALSEAGLVRADFCPTGRGSSQFADGGFRMTVNGRCDARLPVAIVTTSLGGVTLNDGEVAVEVRSTSEAEDRAFLQLFVRLQGGRAGFNGYNVTWSPSLGWAALRRMREGEGTTLAERTDLPPVSLADGATVAVRVQGPTFWLLVNGDVLLSGTDPAEDAIDSGRLGLGVIREGHTDDDDELRVTWRNLRVSRLAEGEPARAPTFQPPPGSAGGPFTPVAGSPPATGNELYYEQMNTAHPPGKAVSMFVAYGCPTGNGSQEFVDEGLKLETRGKCYGNSRNATIGQGPNPFVILPDAELQFEFRIAAGYSRAAIGVGMRVPEKDQGGYWFGIAPHNGIVAISRLGQENEAILAHRTDVGAIVSREGWNHFVIRVAGSQLWLLLNDRPVLKAEDGAFSRGTFYINLDRLGDPNDGEPVEAILRNFQISTIKDAPRNRRPESTLFDLKPPR